MRDSANYKEVSLLSPMIILQLDCEISSLSKWKCFCFHKNCQGLSLEKIGQHSLKLEDERHFMTIKDQPTKSQQKYTFKIHC